MNTPQNYDATASLQPSVEQTAPETAKTPILADDRQETLLSVAESRIGLPLSIVGDGRESEAELVYWALHALKESYLSAGGFDEDEEKRNGFHHASKIQDIQNTLFQSVCELAGELHYQAKNK